MRIYAISSLLLAAILVSACSDEMGPTSSFDGDISSALLKSDADARACALRVNNNASKLLECVTLNGVRAHQYALQSIADANSDRRNVGTPGFVQSAQYVADKLSSVGYSVTMQEFEVEGWFPLGPATLEQTAPGSIVYSEGSDYVNMSYSPAGEVTAAVTPVDVQLGPGNSSTSGCEASDFAGFAAGNIALLQRGSCTFADKASNAESAGASGVIIFNQGNTLDRIAAINGTLSGGFAGTIPVLSARYGLGEEWTFTPGLIVHMIVDVSTGTVTTANVIAETSGGDQSNVVVVGAHLDSVPSGPGINDNGSGSAAILETAIQMAKVNPRNKVRFAWWGAEESGLVGSTHYVNSLSSGEIDAIALYLNFDMIGSPNHGYFIYDGDDSDAVGSGAGPEGSAQIEKVFESFYDQASLPYKGTDFSGRSDYGPFIAVGIPAGGLFTGAEGLKTPDEAALWGGVAGEQFDPCYHLACDTYDNVNLQALSVNSDAVAYATLYFAMSTEIVNGAKGKKVHVPNRPAETE